MRTGIFRTVQVTLLAALSLHVSFANAAITLVTTVVVSRSALPGGYADITASCPEGTIAVSGSIDSSTRAEITTLAPVFDGTPLLLMPVGTVSGGPTGWHGSVMFNPPTAEIPNVLKLAVSCVSGSASVNSSIPIGTGAVNTVIASATALRAKNSNRLQATCPGGSVAIGGGIDIFGADNLSFFRISGNRVAAVGDAPAPQQQLVGWEGVITGAPQVTFIVQPEPKVDARDFKVAAVCLADGREVYHSAHTVSATQFSASATAVCHAGFAAVSGGVLADAGYDKGWLSATSLNAANDGLQRLLTWADGTRETTSFGWYATLNQSGTAAARAITMHALCIPVPPAGPTRPMLEYYNAALDYYFLTSRESDASLLDRTAGWTRTGRSFPVFAAQTAGLAPIRRFYFDQIAKGGSRGSHFYTLFAAEISQLLTLNPGNGLLPGKPYDEGVEAFAYAPTGAGLTASCGPSLRPVYRLFRGNIRFPDNPNHRFTTDVALYNEFVALGWDGEGIKVCVP